MASVLVVILAVELAICLINAIGAAAFSDFLWSLLNRLPTESSRLAVEQRRLQLEVVRVRREMNATSSQDEFAKWAKLRRQHDKLADELEKTKRVLDSARSKFGVYITAARFVFLRAPQFLIPMWFASRPSFWLPYGLFPSWIEWLLCFPRAPRGSVSAGCWQMACAAGFKLASDIITESCVMIWQQTPKSRVMAGSGTSNNELEVTKEL